MGHQMHICTGVAVSSLWDGESVPKLHHQGTQGPCSVCQADDLPWVSMLSRSRSTSVSNWASGWLFKMDGQPFINVHLPTWKLQGCHNHLHVFFAINHMGRKQQLHRYCQSTHFLLSCFIDVCSLHPFVQPYHPWFSHKNASVWEASSSVSSIDLLYVGQIWLYHSLVMQLLHFFNHCLGGLLLCWMSLSLSWHHTE